jgi:wobble nucleotide-excising tRNase
MILKLESLISIGKFRNYQASGDVAFKKTTLVYADNGSGKTTVSSVIRSLSEQDPRRILNRKSTGATLAQSARIIQRPTTGNDVTHTFSANGWRHPFPNIEIFDIHFVDENIYSGCEFSEDHKKQLHQFVMGAQSVAIQHQIDQNKTDKQDVRAKITSLETQVISQVGNGLQPALLTGFLSTGTLQANNIDQRISDASIALQNANSNAVIQNLQLLSTHPQIAHGIDFEVMLRDLSITTQTIQD